MGNTTQQVERIRDVFFYYFDLVRFSDVALYHNFLRRLWVLSFGGVLAYTFLSSQSDGNFSSIIDEK